MLTLIFASALVLQQSPLEAPEMPEVGVPFACGTAFPVSQAHEVGSHLQNDTYAWDFRMPVGTPVVSAYDGVVRLAKGDSTQGGCDPSFAKFSNYVVVAHPNGYETQYLHFSEVTVKVGDKVKRGELLGYSGKTGWACGAHLHFKVARPVRAGWNNPSVRAVIAGYGDPQAATLVAAPACRGPEVILAKNQTGPSSPNTSANAVASADVQASKPTAGSQTQLPSAVEAAAPVLATPSDVTPAPSPTAAGGSGKRL
jgi:murein DD-endopeptidase MepM/ murein hydrolase activator NlpD